MARVRHGPIGATGRDVGRAIDGNGLGSDPPETDATSDDQEAWECPVHGA